MCSVSWSHQGDEGGYLLLFNRDEQRSRESARAPARGSLNKVDYLSPRDGRAGGSWLLANAFGLSIGLLNHYAADTPGRVGSAPEKIVSRGHLVLSLADCRDLADFDTRMRNLDAAGRYRPFLIFALALTAPASLWCWDGQKRLRQIPPPPSRFLTTSSHQTADVLAYRQRHRAALGAAPAPAALRALHHQHDFDRPAHSLRMRRPDAQTVSYSEIIAAPADGVRFLYRPEPGDGLERLAEHHSSLPPQT